MNVIQVLNQENNKSPKKYMKIKTSSGGNEQNSPRPESENSINLKNLKEIWKLILQKLEPQTKPHQENTKHERKNLRH